MKSIDRLTDPPRERAPGVPVWDLPTRLFHWSLVPLFGLAWWSAEQHVDWLHLWTGYTLLFALLFRLLWGLFGSSTARFAGLVRGPAAIRAYLAGGWRRPAAGHNPLGALSVIALLLLLAVQVGLGLVSADEDGEMLGPLANLVSLEANARAVELHEANFTLLQVLIAIHVVAILFYALVLRRSLVRPMISGRAALDPDSPPMRPAGRGRAVACALAALALTGWIVAGAPPLAT